MSDFDARIEAERHRSAHPPGPDEPAPTGRREDWMHAIARIEVLLAATAEEFERRGVAALPVVALPPRKGLLRAIPQRAAVIDRRRPVLDLFSLDRQGRPFLESGALRAEEIWLRVSHPGRAHALRAALLRADLTPDTLILCQGPAITLDPDEATRTGRAGDRFGVAADGALLVYPAPGTGGGAPVPLVAALAAAVDGGR
ncbi:hypothetical protein [Embleya sp. AB8]|uniref:hypothetical protein n=1 Tax=Embleya sp. AB8 TaxID=3156304 RepID=UPI003C765958